MAKNLLIVESPAKAKTINKYLGADFQVLASYGHVRDLRPKEGAVDPEHGFRMAYEVIAAARIQHGVEQRGDAARETRCRVEHAVVFEQRMKCPSRSRWSRGKYKRRARLMPGRPASCSARSVVMGARSRQARPTAARATAAERRMRPMLAKRRADARHRAARR